MLRYFDGRGLAIAILFTFARAKRGCIRDISCRAASYNSRSGSQRQDRDELILRVPSSAGAVQIDIPTTQIKFRPRSRWRRELPAAVISCGRRRTVKQLRERAGNIVNTIPGRSDSRSNPRPGFYSLCRSLLACYRGFPVAWSQSHENWVVPRAHRRTRRIRRTRAIVQPFQTPL